ncbi:MAG: energy-coupling factor transporter ATPase [Firmicutes bacterium]|nr:energy-coupling factor transporter ATPase [Bacillota bacterium]MBQ2083862.1 energy-coupling factor transporter ATPase [Bacillota bacterium]MBQ2147693.1 energy-coupling factor transporter ATPase [Bacillota bacterium]MBQ2218722.1 energy-coupling factor transporter ATPase [Bacillota bacterium]MBQ2228440.1 energy-coupling factor transporter ATPase [Bacillota bacterium]
MQIEVRELGYTYSEGLPFATTALEDVNFTIPSGEFAAIIGHTGSGKSTLLMHLNGLMKPTKGCVLADGIDINEKTKEAREARRKIGLVFQYPEYQLFEETVLKDVCFAPKNYGFTPEECEEKAIAALKLVGIDPDAKRDVSPFELSGGEKRRVAIAGVLAMEPQVLILDEPTAGLDPKGHKDILDMVEKVRRDRNLTILLVSHNMDDAARMADRVLVLDKGHLAMNGTPREVFSHHKELHEIGLGAPSSSELLYLLKEKGLNVRTDIFDEDEAAREIVNALR